jgi:hypothetical protein
VRWTDGERTKESGRNEVGENERKRVREKDRKFEGNEWYRARWRK